MTQHVNETDELLVTFVQQRHELLRHTADVLCSDESVKQLTSEREAKLSAILVSSLEELKVAEEELLERAAELSALRRDLDRRIRGERQLFEFAPTCLLVTDIFGKILTVNHASAMLLKRDANQLEGQLLVAFISLEERRAFRDGLGRLAETEGVTDWRFRLVRPTDAAVDVAAAVRLVKPETGASGARLFWSIRVVAPVSASAPNA